ncbi:hypothetical protein SKAU_G00339030 [Synaphobranchus kaupii]|uniref:Uncharacterized protein n=1 Tax=Synaphobranchus kaupii TaxID=118154 RepID=A0A9Q1IJ11_SYNKA|nr:hypothetical protein SKAU_G00339030 [Synaphobranchus kaupii]
MVKDDSAAIVDLGVRMNPPPPGLTRCTSPVLIRDRFHGKQRKVALKCNSASCTNGLFLPSLQSAWSELRKTPPPPLSVSASLFLRGHETAMRSQLRTECGHGARTRFPSSQTVLWEVEGQCRNIGESCTERRGLWDVGRLGGRVGLQETRILEADERARAWGLIRRPSIDSAANPLHLLKHTPKQSLRPSRLPIPRGPWGPAALGSQLSALARPHFPPPGSKDSRFNRHKNK